MFKTIKNNSSSELIEKKSKFIASVFYVESKEEAEKIINKMEKKYYDAKHNCYAYRIYNENCIVEKYSDNGEPSGTAGAPILNILNKKDICNILVIVTRYFGGILLGTGGLVKAYSEVTLKALENTDIIKKEILDEYEVKVNYKNVEKFKYFIRKNNIYVINEEYLENVIFFIGINKKHFNKLENNNEIIINEFKFIKKICVKMS